VVVVEVVGATLVDVVVTGVGAMVVVVELVATGVGDAAFTGDVVVVVD